MTIFMLIVLFCGFCFFAFRLIDLCTDTQGVTFVVFFLISTLVFLGGTFTAYLLLSEVLG